MVSIQVVSYIGDESAGPSYSVPQLCHALADCGDDVELHSLAPVPPQSQNVKVFAYPRHCFPHWTYGRSPEMADGLKTACKNADIIHNHGLWMAPNIYVQNARCGTNCKLVVGPRGCLASWALQRSRWKKKIVWLWGQKSALLSADMLHATCEKEYHEIRQFGLTQPVVILPNGIDIMPLTGKTPKKYRQLLFLGRLHPVKGVEYLIEAWKLLAHEFPDWELIIAGSGDSGYVQNLWDLAAASQCERMKFIGEVNGDAKYRQYREADLYVLPSHTENFGMTVAEALSAEVPVITTEGTPWRELAQIGAGWQIPIGREALLKTLRHALHLPNSKLVEMGKKGRSWMQHHYNWHGIAEKMHMAYEWLIHGGSPPDWVKER